MDIEYLVSTAGKGRHALRFKLGVVLGVTALASFFGFVLCFFVAISLCDPHHWGAAAISDPSPAEAVGFALAKTALPVLVTLTLASFIIGGAYLIYSLIASFACDKTQDDNKEVLRGIVKEIEAAYGVTFNESAQETLINSLLGESRHSVPEKLGIIWGDGNGSARTSMDALWEVSGDYRWNKPTQLHIDLYTESDGGSEGKYELLTAK